MKQTNQAGGELTSAAELRRQAEQRLSEKRSKPAEDLTDAEVRALVHELQVRQIELEMQNDAILRAKAAAAEASRKYADLFDFAPIGYFVWDERGTIHDVNLGGATLLGLDRRTAMNKRFGQYIAPEDRPRFAEFCLRVVAADAKQTCEIKLLKGEQVAEVLIEATALCGREEKNRLCCAAVIDVTERNRLQTKLHKMGESLKRSDQLNAAILNVLPANIALLDAEGVILSVNDAWRRFASDNGLQAADFEGKNYLELCDRVHGDDANEASAAAAGIRSVLRGDVAEFALEYSCHSPNEQRWFQLMATPLGSDQPEGAVLMHIDVTKRKQAEHVLRLSESRLRLALDVAGMLSSDWVIGAKVVTFSQDYGEYYGLAATGTVVSNADLLLGAVHPADRLPLMEAFRRSLETGRDFEIEFRGPLRQGGQSWYVARGHVLETRDGEPQRMIGIMQEITLRKQAEEALRQSNQELEQRVQERTDQLLANEARFRQIAETIQEVFWIADADITKTHYISPAYERTWGRSCQSLIENPRSFLDAIYPEDRDRVLRSIAERSATNPFVHEYRIVKPDGSIRWILDQGFPVPPTATTTGRFVGVAQDITERRQAEEQLREREQLLSQSQRIAHVGSFSFDLATKRATWTDEMYRLYGKSPETFVPTVEGVLEAVHPDDRPNLWEHIRARLAGENPGTSEYRVLLPDGQVRTLHAWGEIALDEQGRPVRLIGTVQDVTERKRADEAIREGDRNYSALFDQPAIGVAQIDSQTGRFVRINEYCCELLGYSSEEILRLDFQTITHPDDLPEDLNNLVRLRSGELRTFGREKRYFRKDGSVIWARLTVVPLWAENAPPTSHLALVENITEHKQAEETLRVHSQVLQAMSEAVCFLDDQGRIVFTNRALDDMFRYEPGELVGLPVIELIGGAHEEAEQVFMNVVRSIQTNGSWSGEVLKRRKDGTVFWVTAHISQIDIDGAVRYISVQRDITGARNSEEQMTLLQTQLAHVSRLGTLGEMAAGLAHELNQPLAALRLYATAAQDLGAAYDAKQLQQCLARIDEQSCRAGEIVRRMRTFISRRPAQRVPANLNQLLCEVLELLDSELRHAGVKTELKLDDRLPAVSVDRIQIQQVLVNMIRNAVEAMTLLENDTRRLSICTTIADKQVRIGIADTGGGLAPSISARLFEPFHTTKPSGLGLGLAICRTLVEAHGGSIGAEPNPMRGTTFFFSLPVVQDEATS